MAPSTPPSADWRLVGAGQSSELRAVWMILYSVMGAAMGILREIWKSMEEVGNLKLVGAMAGTDLCSVLTFLVTCV